MTHLEIIQKLIGPITPVGCSSRDDERFENLKALCELTNQLVTMIDEVGYRYKDSYEASVKRAAEYASKYLTETIGIE